MTIAPLPSLPLIQRIVAEYYEVSVGQLMLGQAPIEAEARAAFVLVAADVRSAGNLQIGRYLGRSERKVAALRRDADDIRQRDEEFASRVWNLCVECTVETQVLTKLGMRVERELDVAAIARAALHTERGATQLSVDEILQLSAACLSLTDTVTDQAAILKRTQDEVALLLQTKYAVAAPAPPAVTRSPAVTRPPVGDASAVGAVLLELIDALVAAEAALQQALFSNGERYARERRDKALAALCKLRNPHPTPAPKKEANHA